jgi:sortase A
VYHKHVKLSRINTLLLSAIVLVNGYIVVLPLLPNIIFWLQRNDTGRIQALMQTIHTTPVAAHSRENGLIIPAIALDQAVHEGQNPSTLKQGLWHRPASSTPDKGGNTVIVGHRLTYTDPRGTLYHLDKVQPGDELALTWGAKRYLYTVIETKVVGPEAIEVEAPTTEPRLTLYTCTPLWLPKDRLVVVARLEHVL